MNALPGGHPLTDFGSKNPIEEPILDAILMISHIIRAVVPLCIDVSEVYGVSLLVTSRIRITPTDFTQRMLL